MAYINFPLLKTRGLSQSQYLILQCCKQQKFEDLHETLIELCNEDVEELFTLEEKGLVQFIKGKARDTFFQRARSSKSGDDLLELLETAAVTEEDIIIWDWLANIYKKRDKKVGNAKKGKFFLAQFRIQSGINKNNLSFLCHAFIKDPAKMEWSFQLDYVFFKPDNVFTTKFDLEQSKLWHYYKDNQEYFDKKFAELSKADS